MKIIQEIFRQQIQFSSLDDLVTTDNFVHIFDAFVDPIAIRLSKIGIEQCPVEPVFGTLVNYLAMRRMNTRGIKQANKCIIMSAVAYNLKKLLKWESRKIKVMALAKMK